MHNSDYLFIESFYFHGNTEIILIFNYTRVYSSIDFNSVVASTEARALPISTLKNIKEEEWVLNDHEFHLVTTFSCIISPKPALKFYVQLILQFLCIPFG